jgi:hypothetical protein
VTRRERRPAAREDGVLPDQGYDRRKYEKPDGSEGWKPEADPVEIWRVRCDQDGPDSYWHFGIVDRQGRQVETKRLSSAELLALGNLQEHIWAAAPGCLIDVPDRRSKLGKQKHREIMRLIYGAAEIVQSDENRALKKELVSRHSWPSRLELQSAVFEYIEAFYNRQRRHSTLGMVSPAEYEQTQKPVTSIKIKQPTT